MAQKLGEVLIGRGFLSQPQLERALKLQLIFGGHLGTCLLELGFVDELTLARALSTIHEVSCARPEMFDDIPRPILDCLPTDEVRRRHVVPFGRTARALHVAAVHPDNLKGVAALARQRIVQYVAPELCIVTAMEKYYGIPRRRRYLSVSYATVVARAAKRAASVLDADDATSAGSKVEEPSSQAASAPEPPRVPPLREVSRRMSQVANHGELGEALLDFIAERAERSILFDVEADQAVPVNWRGELLEPLRVASFRLALTPHSILGLGAGEPFYCGPLPVDFECASFYGALGISVPREVIVLPLYGESRLEVVLYGDGERIGGAPGTWLSFLDQVGLALRMLDYKLQLCPT